MQRNLKRTLALLLTALLLVGTAPAVFAQYDEPTVTPLEEYSMRSESDAGNILLNRVQQEEQEKQESDYGITSIALDGTTVSVHLSAPEEATLSVSVCSEDGYTVLTSQTTEVHSETFDYTLDLGSVSLPQYYLLSGVLLDKDGEAICQPYVDRSHTQAYETFLALTVDDFDEEDVLNFDEDESSNFAVLNDSVIRAKTDGTKNNVVSEDQDNDVFVIENAEAAVKNLHNGNVLYLADTADPAQDRIIAVDSATVSGNTVTIRSGEETLESVFDVVKIDLTGGLREEDLDKFELGDALSETDVTPVRAKAKNAPLVEKDIPLTLNLFIFENEHASLSATISTVVTLSLSINYHRILLGQNVLDLQFTQKANVTIAGRVTGKIAVEKNRVSMTSPPIPLGPFIVRFRIVPEIEFNLSTDFDISFQTRRDYHYSTIDGEQSTQSQERRINFEPENEDAVSFEMRLGAGFAIEARWTLFTLQGTLTGGVKVAGTVANDQHVPEDDYHNDDFCIEGDARWYTKFSLELAFGPNDRFRNVLAEFSAEWENHLFDFCFYIQNAQPHFIYEPCPNKWRRVSFIVLSDTGESLSGATVYLGGGACAGESGLLPLTFTTTDANGRAEAYYQEGTYTATAECDGYYSNQASVTVENSPQTVQIELEKEPDDPDEPLNPKQGGQGDSSYWKWSFVPIEDSAEQIVDYNSYTNSYIYAYTQVVLTEVPDVPNITIPSKAYVEQYGHYGDGRNYGTKYNVLCDVVALPSKTLFGGHPNIKHVTFSDHFDYIPSRFFAGGSFVSVTIPNNVTSIGGRAFENCKSLVSITIPDSVTYIGCWAFSGCESLVRVTIGKNVESIGCYAFEDCPIEYLTIPFGSIHAPTESVTGYVSDSTEWMGPGEWVSYWVPPCSRIRTLVITGNVTSIDFTDQYRYYHGYSTYYNGNGAFSYCTGLISVTLPDSVKYIGQNAFSGCTELTNITIPNSVTNIGNHAFNGCSGLTGITIPSSVTNIGDSAFEDCTGLTDITIPSSVTNIGNRAFCRCTGLTNITIPNSVTSIGDSAFGGCTGLTGITIPDSVTTIGDSAFGSCTGLTGITIPDSVTTIGDYTFSGCTGLTDITIPSSVTNIGDSAFDGCPHLQDVYYEGTQEQWSVIAIGWWNEPLLSATIHFGQEDETCNHTYSASVTAEPTCTAAGLRTYTCSKCGDSYTESIPALGHNFGEWIAVKEPTTDAEGLQERTCTRCGTKESQALPKIPTKTVTDAGSGISLTYPETAYNGDVELQIEQVFDGAAFNLVSLNSEKNAVFDISTTVNGTPVQPSTKVTVRIPVPTGFDPAKCMVYHVSTETGKLEKMTARYENGCMVFETNHFSYYAILIANNPPAVAIHSFTANKTIDYRTTITFSCDPVQNPVSGASVHWFINNQDKGASDTYTEKEAKANFTVQAKYIKDGKILAESETEMVNVKTGFFARLKAFFRALFGRLPKEVQEAYDLDLFLNLLP